MYAEYSEEFDDDSSDSWPIDDDDRIRPPGELTGEVYDS